MFEGVTTPYRQPFHARSLALAVGVHALAIGVVIWSASRIKALVSEPAPVVIFRPAAKLPPPPPPPARATRTRTEQKKRPDPTRTPTRIPD